MQGVRPRGQTCFREGRSTLVHILTFMYFNWTRGICSLMSLFWYSCFYKKLSTWFHETSFGNTSNDYTYHFICNKPCTPQFIQKYKVTVTHIFKYCLTLVLNHDAPLPNIMWLVHWWTWNVFGWGWRAFLMFISHNDGQSTLCWWCCFVLYIMSMLTKNSKQAICILHFL